MDVETCRICANFYVTTNEVELMHLFQPPPQESLQRDLNFIISEINAWQLNVVRNDGLPQLICANCFAKFSTIYTFRQECEAAQSMLRNALGSKQEKDEVVTQDHKAATTLDMQQQLFQAQENDANENITSNVDAIIEEIDENCRDGVAEPSNLVVNYNVSYDSNGSANLVIHNGGVMQAAINDVCSNNDQNTNASCTSVGSFSQNASSEDLEEMLTGSVIPKNFTTKNVNRRGMKRKTNSSVDVFEKDDQTDAEDESFDERPAQRIANFAFACNYCYCPSVGPIGHLIFKSADALSQHFFDIHDPNLPYPCPECPKLFSTNCRRNDHVARVHGIGARRNIRCPYCRKVIRTPLEMHESSCTYVSDWQCKVCERSFRQMPLHTFYAHQRTHYSKPKYRCEICKRDFMRRGNFESHKKMHAETCAICKQYFVTAAELKQHELSEHSANAPLRCKYCKKDFSSLAFLERHMENLHSHETTQSFSVTTCSNCNVTFPTKLKLYFHQQRPKDENGQCILQFSRNSRLHYFCCPHCPKRFSARDQLDFHLQIHNSRLRSHSCDKCMLKYSTARELQLHISTKHLNKDAFACDECDERFGYQKDLENHKLYHARLTYKCSRKNCNAMYNTEEDLRQHIHWYHDTVTCESCFKTCKRKELEEHQSSGSCCKNLNTVPRALNGTFNSRKDIEENQVGTVSSTTNSNGNVCVQYLHEQQSVILKEDIVPPTEVQQNVLDFLQSEENVIHAPDVPLNNDDFFISSLLDPDNEIIIT